MTTSGVGRPVSAPSMRRTALRRWPALFLLVVAGALAILLPSGLTIPTSGPSTLAEYAPVPGEGDGQSDISEVGQGSSGGLGVGAGDGPTSDQNLQPNQPRPRLKRCVGTPPRQTEDPLSPPCVAHFAGDNGGATTRGVTRDEITVVMHWDAGNPPRFVDYAEPITESERDLDRIGKVFAQYFNDRYQLYGRRAHFWGYYGRNTTNQSADVKANVLDINTKNPFALVSLFSNQMSSMSIEAASQEITTAAYSGLLRSEYQRSAPRLVSYSPDIEDAARNSASYICRKLVDRPARFSGNVDDLNRRRKFGLLYTDGADDPTQGQLARALRAEIIRQCNEDTMDVPIQAEGAQTWDDYPAALARMRTNGVTTVVVMTKSGDVLTYLPAASSQSWRPEWFFPRQQGNGPDDTASSRIYPQDQWRHAFGVSYDSRRPQTSEQNWVRAYVDACPKCPLPTGYQAPRAYETLSLLFYGIQTAGPRLTPANFDKGLHAVQERKSTSPYIPATYFYPGNYSWVKDAKEMWWDVAGQTPGDGKAGCYRLPNEGRRYRFGEWPEGDEGLFEFTGNQPCQGSAQFQ